jgi:hypothetical protein
LFNEATFEETSFSGAEILGGAVFNDSVFSGRVVFENSILLPDLLENCLDPRNCISFRHVRFEKPEEVVFDGCYMRRVSFIHTDVSRIVFRNANWGEDFRVFDEKQFLIKTGKKRTFLKECEEKFKRILDVLGGKKEDEEIEREVELEPEIREVLTELDRLKEKKENGDEDKKKHEELEERLRELKGELRKRIENSLNDLRKKKKWGEIFEEEKFKVVEKDNDLTLDNVLAVYRGLRDNYDYRLKYEESGRFFINEMRLRRIVGREHDGEKPHGLGGIKTRLSDIAERVVMWFYEVLA